MDYREIHSLWAAVKWSTARRKEREKINHLFHLHNMGFVSSMTKDEILFGLDKLIGIYMSKRK